MTLVVNGFSSVLSGNAPPSRLAVSLSLLVNPNWNPVDCTHDILSGDAQSLGGAEWIGGRAGED